MHSSRRVRESRPLYRSQPLLPRHRDAQELVRADQVVDVLGGLVDVDLDPADPPGEGVVGPVVVADGSGAVATEVQRLVRGEEHRHGVLDAALTDLVAVEVERDVAALGQAAAVVGELHADLVLAGGDRVAPRRS